MQQAEPDHQVLFTPTDTAAHDQTFPLFRKLPAELRCEIWTKSLEQRQRILRIGLRCRPTNEDSDDEPYVVVARGHHTISRLFRVNHESRASARLFYRVRLLASLVARSGEEKPGVLYINPELDFLSLGGGGGGRCAHDGGHAVEFLHRLRVMHDPRGVGALNLAVSLADLSHAGGGFHGVAPSMLAPDVAEGFAATLAQLREVWFVQTQSLGRQVFGHRSGAREDGNRRSAGFPVAATGVPGFRRLGPDPRPVEGELGRVFVGEDPREVVQLWARLLDVWLGGEANGSGTMKTSRAEQRVVLTEALAGEDIYDEGDAVRWLAKERQEWEEQTEGDEGGQILDSENGVVTAVGFWLFPTQAFGPLPEGPPYEELEVEQRRYVDVRRFRPELALQSLPLRYDGSSV